MRRLLAVFAVLVGSAALSVALAPPIGAHHLEETDLQVKVECNPTTGLFDGKATLSNSAAGNSAFTIESSSNGLTYSPNPISQGSAGSATITGLPGGVAFTETISGHFATGEAGNESATVTPEGDCVPPTTTTVTVPTSDPKPSKVSVPVEAQATFTG